MRMSVKRLRALVAEARVGASPAYLQKEKVRDHVEKLIVSLVKSGEIHDQRGLDDFCSTAEMALDALKMVPVEVYARMAHTKR